MTDYVNGLLHITKILKKHNLKYDCLLVKSISLFTIVVVLWPPLICFLILIFVPNMHNVHRAQAHIACISQIDNNRLHEHFVTALGLGP